MRKQITEKMIRAAGVAIMAATVFSGSAYSQTLVRDVDKPGYLPYQVTLTHDAKGDPEVYLTFPAPPAGKRLVIEHASIKLTLWSGAKGACELAGGVAGQQGYTTALHIFSAPVLLYSTGYQNNDFYSISESMRFYIDAQERSGIPPIIHCPRESIGGKSWPVTATLAGYLMDQKAQ